MVCYCTARVSNPKPKTCTDCLIANKIIVGCNQEIYPCGTTKSVNLAAYNGNPSDTVYSLQSNPYSTGDFTSASITSAGVLTFTTGENYTPHGLHEIKYMVSKGKFKDFESVWICFDSPCEDGCTNCNTCSGECYGAGEDVEAVAECAETGKTFNAATGLNIASCDGTNTWTVEAPSAISAIIDSNGLITYDITSLAVPGTEYTIDWKVKCSLYNMEASGKLIVLVENKCIGVTCASNEECNKCTGDCEEKESDMDVTQNNAFGAGASGGMSLS